MVVGPHLGYSCSYRLLEVVTDPAAHFQPLKSSMTQTGFSACSHLSHLVAPVVVVHVN